MKTDSRQLEECKIWDEKAKKNAEGEVWRERDSNWCERVKECIENIFDPFADAKNDSIRILDIGCGMGRLSEPIAKMNPKSTVIGIDISREMIKIAKRNAKLSNLKNIHYKVGDGVSLQKIQINSIDLVYSMVTFQHIPLEIVKSYIKEISNVLKKGGKFRIQFVVGDYQSFNQHQHKEVEINKCCDENNLRITKIDRDLMFKSWVWITGVKI